MVTIDYHQKLTRLLELYLLKQTISELPTTGYRLIALMPIDPNSWIDRQTLLLCFPKSIEKSKKQLIHDLFTLLKGGLPEEDYLSTYNIDLLQEDSFAVKRLNSWEPQYVDKVLSVPISVIGGVTSQTITVIRSNILEKLAYHKLMHFRLNNGRIIEGKITEIYPSESDARLTFETNEGWQNCLFTEIIHVSEL
jgi:hypothetical protein